MDDWDIRRSNDGAYYTMYHNGIFVGNYDTVAEAAKDLEEIKNDIRNKNS